MSALEACNEAIQGLKESLKDAKLKLVEESDKILASTAKSGGAPPPTKLILKPKRKLDGHFGKIYAFQWGPDSQNLVSASQDGNMFVWNSLFALKIQGITLRSSWVMACGYSPNGKLVSTAGLDNVVWIYKVQEGATEEVDVELAGHEGYISTCSFISDTQMITTSGDCSAALWDISSKRMIQEFTEHTLDVNTCAIAEDGKVFATGSCDATAKVWDLRVGNKSVRTFIGHDSDVNALCFLPGSETILSGSDDSTCRLFDMRSYGVLNVYHEEKHYAGVTSNTVSKTGKYSLVSYDTGPVYIWDTLSATVIQKMDSHEKRVSRVRVSPDGYAVGTASWDASLIIWYKDT